ncbi:hypothetical protein [Raineyella sp. LH-20]|uniref:hypothetical protein n=1 Tax=Raineyella sp. LH-20 TaxID=3081204 RepID=UPI002954AAF1|nr:hypothetical protein [Raineyella sp. LH-20]WOP18141.1 hypothetical protein R0146_13035 [Raineyella sp. LH-20]
MSKQSVVVSAVSVAVMVVLIVGVDLAFFRDRFWLRLIANIGIVLVFVACYFRFLKH